MRAFSRSGQVRTIECVVARPPPRTVYPTGVGSGLTRTLAGRPLCTRHRRKAKKSQKNAASLGVIRLDYDYPPAPGDIDSPDSFAYDVFYRVVPGLTFEMCQHAVPGTGTPLPADVMKSYVEAIKYLDEDKNVSGSTLMHGSNVLG